MGDGDNVKLCQINLGKAMEMSALWGFFLSKGNANEVAFQNKLIRCEVEVSPLFLLRLHLNKVHTC